MSEEYTYQELKDKEIVSAEKRNNEPKSTGGKRNNKRKSVIDKYTNMLPSMEAGLQAYKDMKPMTPDERREYVRQRVFSNTWNWPYWFSYLSISDMEKCIGEFIGALDRIKSKTMEPKEADKILKHWQNYGWEVWRKKLRHVNDGQYHSAYEFMDD